MSEREQIVAWLREDARRWKEKAGEPLLAALAVGCAANAIERGEHLKETQDD